MQPPNQHSRINLAELKAQIVKKLGPEGSKHYFYYLNKFLNLKLSKAEFNKLCLRVLSRENIPIHNQFIRSILRNACTSKSPPSASDKDVVLKNVTQVSGNEILPDGYQQNGSHVSTTQAPGLPNGVDMLPVSPRKARTGPRERRDRRSALGLNGKSSFAPPLSSAAQSSDFNVVLENGALNPPDVRRPMQHHQEVMQDKADLVIQHDETEASRSPLRAPLGVPLCPVSIGGPRRALLPSSSSRCISTSNGGALFDSLTLRERMEQIALAEGLEGVSVDCANILNHGLDTYIKGLLRSCVELVGAKSGHELIKKNTLKHDTSMKLINGVKPGYGHQMQYSGKNLEGQEQRIHSPISLQEFRVAMELNPRQLGEDWPILLEKICTNSFEE
ncbi:hypothetical protein ACJIZ3_005010 [Penstemon smallii]|uniref:Transcriptional coactivator Hfi1/Transcriptional adapter 1 n=1 Tax=Penstemon smallii TaxID=265156 RepID=A0ABD3S3Q3_9LAMI